MANLNTLINLADIAKVSKSFGIVGAAANKTPIIIVNDNQPIATQEIIINKPIVKMINVLASIDGFLKQRLENQKAIARNEILANRESNIEQKNQEPEIHVITPDAEKESGSGLGLLALGGLALLAFDPVQDAIKQIADLTVQSGQFISNAVRTINDVFNFLFSSSSDTPENPNTAGQINPASGTPSQGQDQQNQTETRGQPPSEERPAPVANTTDATPAVAATGNELVDKGLIHIEPNVSDKFSIPRIKGGTMLQKRKEQPTGDDSKGDFDYSEVVLKPVDFIDRKSVV
jgi:hypothetical protein